MTMQPDTSAGLAQTRLLQLVSSGLPVGAFTYSQGLEWAVEKAWVDSRETLQQWLSNQLGTSIAALEAPIFLRMMRALRTGDAAGFGEWVDFLIANRETAELRFEEAQRGRAMARLLPALGVIIPETQTTSIGKTQLAGFALAAHAWQIPDADALRAWFFSWLENGVLAGVKLIPLGQTHGQQILFSLCAEIDSAMEMAAGLDDHELGYSCLAQVIASSLHETQYTRLYRS